jgi:hypothetical protein
VSEDPVERQRPGVDERPCETDRLGRLGVDPGAVVAAVDFEPHPVREAVPFERVDRRPRVHQDTEDRALGDLAGLLDPTEDQRECPRDVVEAGVCERTRLLERRDRNAARSEVPLHAADLHALVGLHVRPKGHS